jgi:hypothetical protein
MHGTRRMPRTLPNSSVVVRCWKSFPQGTQVHSSTSRHGQRSASEWCRIMPNLSGAYKPATTNRVCCSMSSPRRPHGHGRWSSFVIGPPGGNLRLHAICSIRLSSRGISPVLSGAPDGRNHEGDTPLTAIIDLFWRIKAAMAPYLSFRAVGPRSVLTVRSAARRSLGVAPRLPARVYLTTRVGFSATAFATL